MKYVHINGDSEVFHLLASFMTENHKELLQQKLTINFIMHTVNLYQMGCLSAEHLAQLIGIAQKMHVLHS